MSEGSGGLSLGEGTPKPETYKLKTLNLRNPKP